MGKESYDIDNILSEVKKRKANQAEKSDVSLPDLNENTEENTINNADEENFVALTEKVSDDEDSNIDMADDKSVEEVITDDVRQDDFKLTDESDDSLQQENNEETFDDETKAFEKIKEEKKEFFDEIDKHEITFNETDSDLDESTAEEEYTDIGELSEKKSKKTDFKERLRKVTIAFLSIILAALIAGGGYAYFEIYQPLLNTFQESEEETTSRRSTSDELVENFEPIFEAQASDVASFEDMIKQWYKNGTPCSSSHIYNVMLIGEDTRGSEILDEGTRADAVIVASVNVDTKQITLTSVLRDTWAYYETTSNDESTGHFNKINSAMSVGDVKTYIRAFENLYKIDINNYVIINFDAFEEVVDILGGVTLDISYAEMREINNHPKRYGNVTIPNYGEVTLNGKQALAYCRIRKIDSDNARANRQKECLMKIFDGVKNTSKTNMLKIVTKLLPYVKTDLDMNSITSVAEDAFTQGWLGYKIQTTSVPNSRITERGASGTFSWANNQWIWKADFPQDAYNLQTVLYGKSNITLAQTRVDFVNCTPTGFRSQGASAVTATIINYNYGIVTTTEIESEEDENEE